MPRSMFETLCEGVHRELCCGHRRRWLPLAAAGRQGLPLMVIVVIVVIQRRCSVGRGEDDSNDRMGYTFVTTTTTTTYDDKTCTIA